MFTIIRTKCEQTMFGEHWAEQFTSLLDKVQLTFEKQLTWQKLESISRGGFDREELSSEHITPQNEERIRDRKEESKKEICLKFLRKELLVHTVGCTKPNCGRAHQEVFTWSKGYVLGQLAGIEGSEELMEAVRNEQRFA